MTDFELAVSSEMVFTDLPILDRVRRIDDMGFAVEIWSWHDKDLAGAGRHRRPVLLDDGLPARRPDRPATADEVVRTAELSIKAAETLGVPRLNLHTAELVDGKAARPRLTGHRADVADRAAHPGAHRRARRRRRACTFCVENLNTIVDHPGVPLARAKDTLALVEAVGSSQREDDARPVPRPDRRGESDRTGPALRRRDRRDPGGRRARAMRAGTGEINYPAIAKALRDIGFTGTVGLEAWASGDSTAALRSLPSGVQLIASWRR